ncbi:MAG: hypothetical protein HZB29_13695 [Nitrospinae bacterium]|nr:hypothetical protein [Nitrospinota bacterium]
MSEKDSPLKHAGSIPITGAVDGSPMPFHSIVASPDGGFFLSDEFNHRVLKVSDGGEVVSVIGKRGGGPGEFWYPRGMAVVQNAGVMELVVCDAWNHRIQRFGMDGGHIGSFGSVGNGGSGFDEPTAVLDAGEGHVWILDRCNHRVKKCALGGVTVYVFGGYMTRVAEQAQNDLLILLGAGAASRGLNYPMSFARLDDGTFVIADTGSRRLVHVTKTGDYTKIVKLDVEGHPPYHFPVSITPVDGSVVLVGAVGSAPRIMDIKKPWLSVEATFDADISRPPAALSRKRGDGVTEIFIADGVRKVVDRYEFDHEKWNKLAAAAAPHDFPDEEELKTVPNHWTEKCGDEWRIYLDCAPKGKVTDGKLSWYAGACRSSAISAARGLMETESELLRAVASHCEAMEAVYGAKDRAAASVANEAAMKEALSAKLLQKKRSMLRWALMEDMARLTDVFAGDTWMERLSGERADFQQLMESELEARGKDFAEIVVWLSERLNSPGTVHVKACAHAFAAAGFLLDHIKYTRKSIMLLGGAPENVQPLESEKFISALLEPYGSDSLNYSNKVLTIIAHACVVWDYVETADFVYKALETRHETYRRANPMQALEAAERFQRHGELFFSGKFISRFSTSEGGGAADWQKASRRQEILSSQLPTIRLVEGELISGALGQGLSLPSGADAGYLKSIHLLHPYTAKAIRPHLILPLSASRLIVSDVWAQELFLCEEDDGACRLRPLLDNPAVITCLDRAPSGEILMVMRTNPADPNGGYMLKILNIETGVITDIPAVVYQGEPLVPYKAYYNSSGLIVYDQIGAKGIFRVSGDFMSCELIGAPPVELGEIKIAGGRFIATAFPADAAVREFDPEGGEWKFVDDNHLLTPVSAAKNKEGILFVATDTGVQAYGADGRAIYQIGALLSGGAEMKLDSQCLSIMADARFLGGDLLAADAKNNAIHIFKQVSVK